MSITLFGTCRLSSLSTCNNRIRDEISYTYDTKEILEVIKFIKYNHVTPEQTITTFRTPMLTNQPIYSKNFENIFEESDTYIIEISSKKTYKYNNFAVHSHLYTMSNDLIKKDIEIIKISDEEFENDILEIINELKTRKIIFVSHIVTDEKSSRYELAKLLEQICLRHYLLYINPVREIIKRGYDINDLVLKEEHTNHYNDLGHKIIKEIYEDYINLINKSEIKTL